jgi:thioesterase domain-containing protein
VALLVIIDSHPINLRPRTLKGRLRGWINAPLILTEKIVRLTEQVQDTPTTSRWQAYGRVGRRLAQAVQRKIRGMIARRRLAASRDDDPNLTVQTVERMYGMSRWPKNYQRIANINLQAMMRYRPRAFDGRVALIRRRSPLHRYAFDRPDWGWSELGPAVDVHYVDGNHDEIMVEPRVGDVGRIIQGLLDVAANEVHR